MSNQGKAILIPVSFRDQEKKYGSIIHHAMHLGKTGGVFWHVNIPGEKTVTDFQHKKVRKGYFYSTMVKKVLYSYTIKEIGPITDFTPYEKYAKYVPEWRIDDWKSSIKTPHGFWVLIQDIRELLQPQDLSKFEKYDPYGEKLHHGKYPYSLVIEKNLKEV